MRQMSIVDRRMDQKIRLLLTLQNTGTERGRSRESHSRSKKHDGGN
jgi:hypothetical protein